MGSITLEERATVRAFLDAIFGRFLDGQIDDYTAKVAIEGVISDAVLGSRAKAFDYMQSVIEGKGG